MKVHGREKDIALLEQLYASKRPEFVVVYGRRRVGKTYLVSELFKSRFAFYHTGLSPLNHNKIAQLVEQRTENPRVSGSIPELGIFYYLF